MTTKTIAKDPRTDAQRKLDEAIAAGDWTGFTTEELLTEEGALELIAYRENLAIQAHAALRGLLNQPFRWKTKVYRILKCEFTDGRAAVKVAPHDDELVAEIQRRVAADRFHHLAYCQGFGFACFPEDFAKYQG